MTTLGAIHVSQVQESGWPRPLPLEPVLSELEAHGLDNPTVRAIRDRDWISVVTGPIIDPGIAAWDPGAWESQSCRWRSPSPGPGQ